MNSFMTGSRVYGTPSNSSDVDLVVLMNQNEINDLIAYSDLKRCPIRYGNLNIIALNSLCEYHKWENAMIQCLTEAPVTRERAVEIHKANGIDLEEVSKTKAQLIAEGVL